MSGLVTSATVQTILVCAAPLLLPRLISAGRSLISQRAPEAAHLAAVGSSPPSLRRPRGESQSPLLSLLRLLLLSLSLSLALFTALRPPPNLFLTLAPATSTLQALFPVLRQPLDLRLPTESLSARLTQVQRRPLDQSQLQLLQTLQTLDARIAYAAFGSQPLLSCSWCRKPSEPGSHKDYAIDRAPTIALQYLAVLVAVGWLSSGPRRRWRSWLVSFLFTLAGYELYMRVNWRGISGGAIVMIDSQMHIVRHVAFAFVLLSSYLAPIPLSEAQPPCSADYVAPTIGALIQQQSNSLQRVRALGLQRMAVLHSGESRTKIDDFWEQAEEESLLARADPSVSELMKERVASPTRSEESDRSSPGDVIMDRIGFREWLDRAMAVKPLSEQHAR